MVKGDYVTFVGVQWLTLILKYPRTPPQPGDGWLAWNRSTEGVMWVLTVTRCRREGWYKLPCAIDTLYLG